MNDWTMRRPGWGLATSIDAIPLWPERRISSGLDPAIHQPIENRQFCHAVEMRGSSRA